MNIERVEGVEWLRQYSAEWDDLWLRSDVCLPSSRAEPLAWWHEQFSSKWSFRAVLVRDAGKLVAAFPWETRGRWPRTGRLPFNDWFPGGLALVDPAYATREVAELLLDGLAAERCHVSVFRNARWESPLWRRLVEAVADRRWPLHQHSLYETGTVDLTRTWEQLEAGFTANHRHKMRKAWRRSEREGGVTLEVKDRFGPGELDRLLRVGFELERSGWKGQAGTAVLQQPGFFEFILRESEYLARDGQVRLAFLRRGDQVIAFEYTWVAKGVVSTPKIAYEEAFSRLSPGQQLLHWTLRDLAQAGVYRSVDYVGPMTESTRRCCTGSYTTGTIVLGQVGGVGQAGVWAYRMRRAWKNRSRVVTQGPTA
jgi:CelD/BcsL family acetyltransferase involved in cellulose biosynthesis